MNPQNQQYDPNPVSAWPPQEAAAPPPQPAPTPAPAPAQIQPASAALPQPVSVPTPQPMGDLASAQPFNPVPQVPQPQMPPISPVAPTPMVGGPIAPMNSGVTASAPIEPGSYTSNPFTNATQGIVMVLSQNPASIMLASLLYFVVIFLVILLMSAAAATFFLIPVAALFYLAAIAWGVGAFTAIAAASMDGQKLDAMPAFSRAIRKTLPMVAFFIIVGVLFCLSSLLLLIPGLIFLARVALGPLLIIRENLGPIKAMKRSVELTKGHTFEMLGSTTVGLFLGGGGLLNGAIAIGPALGRYKDLTWLQKSGAPKPKLHWLNYGAVLLLVAFFVIVIVVSIVGTIMGHSLLNSKLKSNTCNSYSSSNSIDYATSSCGSPSGITD